MKEFDLNIEKVLENWTVTHAIREIIANALDEQILTGTDEIEIYRDKSGRWHIRDYGRGIQYQHLTQNENEEKQNHPHLIGKFGVGLKDALATFNRHGMDVIIDSKHGRITVGQSAKHGFSDITTLHAYIDDPVDKNFEGTDFCIVGCSRSDIEAAKDLFLEFAPIRHLEKTAYGDVLQKRNGISEIFINGIKVAEEENFLFSYNITALNASLRKALNRERTNVGRTAYSDRIRAILLSAESEAVLSVFTDNLTQMSNGKQADELKWVDVQAHAVRHLSARKETVYVTPEEIQRSSGAVLEVIRNSGKQAVLFGQINRYDSSGKKIGESRPSFFGGMNHYDAKGHKTGYSDRAFFGGVNHYDNHGHKTGHTDRAFGGGINHYNEKRHKIGYSGRSFFGGVNHYSDDSDE